MISRKAIVALSAGLLALGLASGASLGQQKAGWEPNYGTATPYRPQQDRGSYQAPPAGFAAVYTQLLARHGSRGLSAPKLDLAVYSMWQRASADGLLTELGAKLGPDLEKTIRANALLGYGVPGITKPGYGNETSLGKEEHTGLAQRMLDRMPDFWQGIIGSETPRQIVIVSSGVDRAMDSEGFFVRSLTTRQPALAKFVTKEPAPAGYPEGNPKVQPVGTNRFVLYFHKLVPERDLVTNPKDRYLQTYRDSQSYQEYLKGGDYKAKHAAVLADPAGKAAGRAVLERLFKKPFVDAIDAGTYTFANTGSFAFTSDDGKYTAKVKGDGKTKIKSLADAGLYIYQLYAAAPAIKAESGVDLTPYLAAESSDYFAQAEDGLSFYRMGPGITEKGDITWKMAQILQDDFFAEVDAIAGGRMKHGAKLRFAHAEIVVPFASKLGLKSVLAQVPLAAMFSYPSNPWRGNYVAPMASNLQWDVYSDGKGTLLVKMLFNERETDFKAECDGAKVAPDSRYYDYRKLRACYGYKPLS